MDRSESRVPGTGEEPRDEPILKLLETPHHLLEAVVAAEVLGPPLALREGSTPGDRRAF